MPRIVLDYSYMNTPYNVLTSRTFWTLVVMGLIPLVNLFVPFLPATFQAVAEVILAALASYFHVSAVNTAGATH